MRQSISYNIYFPFFLVTQRVAFAAKLSVNIMRTNLKYLHYDVTTQLINHYVCVRLSVKQQHFLHLLQVGQQFPHASAIDTQANGKILKKSTKTADAVQRRTSRDECAAEATVTAAAAATAATAPTAVAGL